MFIMRFIHTFLRGIDMCILYKGNFFCENVLICSYVQITIIILKEIQCCLLVFTCINYEICSNLNGFKTVMVIELYKQRYVYKRLFENRDNTPITLHCFEMVDN